MEATYQLNTPKRILFFAFLYVTFQIGMYLITSDTVKGFFIVFNAFLLLLLFMAIKPYLYTLFDRKRLVHTFKTAMNIQSEMPGASLLGKQLSSTKNISNQNAKHVYGYCGASFLIDSMMLFLCIFPVYIYRLIF